MWLTFVISKVYFLWVEIGEFWSKKLSWSNEKSKNSRSMPQSRWEEGLQRDPHDSHAKLVFLNSFTYATQ